MAKTGYFPQGCLLFSKPVFLTSLASRDTKESSFPVIQPSVQLQSFALNTKKINSKQALGNWKVL